MIKSGAVATMLFALGGCASIVSGSTQEIQLKSEPSVPVTCEAQNGRGHYTANDKPGMLLVKRSQTRLNIDCKGEGYNGKYSEQAGAEGWVFGNILIGGLIGLTIDGITGSMFSYDNALTIPLQPTADIAGTIPAPVLTAPVSEAVQQVAPAIQETSPAVVAPIPVTQPNVGTVFAPAGTSSNAQPISYEELMGISTKTRMPK